MQAISSPAALTVGRAAALFAAGRSSQNLQVRRSTTGCNLLRKGGNLHRQLGETSFSGEPCTYLVSSRGLSGGRVSMGIEKEQVKAGSGPKPQKGQTVTVHCTGYGKDRDLSKKFWSTKDPGQEPFTFRVGLGQVIKGWDEGVLNMQRGEVSRLTCSPDYAYGAGGFPAWGIQPNSTLLFEIEVLEFK
ncbi:FKBP-type peptidyl-prolyl cis-trans isomerase [Klebsormidium nitens]|uniref:peptidylprolyl isomerase n=1 Tax=Klebsormidium nitens TaxID=105231 RepID=A0A1Y1IEE0_KLENI|nr:FKBP-type peptidyl-prolyl cis-trans isomerase [Klebsormidium nitens]|eukprot:GAQ88332.1 FKBP-type peptidyl-prolyl cis-trans isomerase [Klebsormidium nitens]